MSNYVLTLKPKFPENEFHQQNRKKYLKIQVSISKKLKKKKSNYFENYIVFSYYHYKYSVKNITLRLFLFRHIDFNLNAENNNWMIKMVSNIITSLVCKTCAFCFLLYVHYI